MQRGVIGKAQVVAKPDDDGRGGGHRASQLGGGRTGPAAVRCNSNGFDTYQSDRWRERPEADLKRAIVLYVATLVDFVFLGSLARGFFVSEVGDMLSDIVGPLGGDVIEWGYVRKTQ